MTLHIELHHPDRLEVRYRVGKGTRVMLTLMSSVPLACAFAMGRGLWEAPLGLASLFFAVLGVAAALVGVGMLLAAGGSNDEVLDVDRRTGMLTRIDASPLGRRRRASRPISQISRLETHIEEWSDSASHHLAVHFQDGDTIRFGSSNARAPIDQLRQRVAEFLAG